MTSSPRAAASRGRRRPSRRSGASRRTRRGIASRRRVAEAVRACRRRCQARPAPLPPCAARGARGRPVPAVPGAVCARRSDARRSCPRRPSRCAARWSAAAAPERKPPGRARGLPISVTCAQRASTRRSNSLHGDPAPRTATCFSTSPFSTSLPIMVPDSSFSCALLRFAPLIGESVSFSVPRSLPASSQSATWSAAGAARSCRASGSAGA